MKIVETGNTYKIYRDDLKTYDLLPTQVYKANFSKLTGFFLELNPEIKVIEKLYGHHVEKVNKILDAFPKFERNLGVIFSGDKGIGKSIAAKLMAQLALDKGYPVILVNEYLPGIADFLNQIEQEVVVIFDEFDKTFATSNRRDESSEDRQTELLTLLDGFGVGKKLYVVTCNNLHNLNDFLVNRPGRFHYHIVFKYPTADEIREYLHDKLNKKYYGEIEAVVAFSLQVDLNYDCLRAIAFELNCGLSFVEAISDLNIVNTSKEDEKYNAIVTLANGEKIVIKKYYMDSFYDGEVEFFSYNDKYKLRFYFTPAEDLDYDMEKGCQRINPNNIQDTRMWVLKSTKNGDKNWVELEENKFVPIKDIVFKRIISRKDIHYSYTY